MNALNMTMLDKLDEIKDETGDDAIEPDDDYSDELDDDDIVELEDDDYSDELDDDDIVELDDDDSVELDEPHANIHGVMKVLFLDDDHDRLHSFLDRCEPWAEITIVYSAASCISQLRHGGPFAECHLDHDLTGESYCDPDRDDTGMEVVRWICCAKPDVRTFVVHTHNEIAAPLMMKALEAAGYRVVRAPFSFSN